MDLGMHSDLKIFLVVNPISFWVKRSENGGKGKEFAEFEKEFNNYFSKVSSGNTSAVPNPGQNVAASHCGKWYRGIVMEIFNTSDYKLQETSVYFSDYGNVEKIPASSLYPLRPGEWESVPSQAVHIQQMELIPLSLNIDFYNCNLNLKPRPAVKWDKAAEDFMKKLQEAGAYCNFHCMGELKDGTYGGDVYVKLPDSMMSIMKEKYKINDSFFKFSTVHVAELLIECQFAAKDPKAPLPRGYTKMKGCSTEHDILNILYNGHRNYQRLQENNKSCSGNQVCQENILKTPPRTCSSSSNETFQKCNISKEENALLPNKKSPSNCSGSDISSTIPCSSSEEETTPKVCSNIVDSFTSNTSSEESVSPYLRRPFSVPEKGASLKLDDDFQRGLSSISQSRIKLRRRRHFLDDEVSYIDEEPSTFEPKDTSAMRSITSNTSEISLGGRSSHLSGYKYEKQKRLSPNCRNLQRENIKLDTLIPQQLHPVQRERSQTTNKNNYGGTGLNLSSMSRVYYSGDLMVHESKLILNAESAESALNYKVWLKYSLKKFCLPRIQHYMWPTLLRGQSCFTVGCHKAGKTVGYIIPIISCLVDCFSIIERRLPNAVGPLIIIICKGWMNIESVNGYLKDILPDEPFIKVTLVKDLTNVEKTEESLTGCDILVTTLPLLMNLLTTSSERERENKGLSLLSLKRCYSLIIDDADFIFQKRSEDIIELVKNWTFRGKVPRQLIIVGQRWDKNIDRCYKDMKDRINPSVIISSPLEAAIACNVNTVIHYLNVDDVYKTMIDVVKHNESKKIVIFVSSAEEAEICSNHLQSIAFHCIRITSGYFWEIKDKLDKFKNSDAVLIVLEEAMSSVVSCDLGMGKTLIHLGLPKSLSNLNNRYSFLLNSMGRVGEGKSPCSSYFLLTISHIWKRPVIVEELARLQEIPEEVRSLQIQALNVDHHENDKINLCPFIKSVGVCDQQGSCTYNHSILRSYTPKNLPITGEIEFDILNVFSPSHFSIRLITWSSPEGEVENLQMYYTLLQSSYLNRLFQNKENLLKIVSVVEGVLCATEFDKTWVRARIRATNFQDGNINITIYLIDEGFSIIKNKSDLYELPECLKDIPGMAIEARLSNLAPANDDPDWSENALEITNSFKNPKENVQCMGKIVFALDETLWLKNVQPKLLIGNRFIKRHTLNSKLKPHYAVDNPNHIDTLRNMCDGKIEFSPVSLISVYNKAFERADNLRSQTNGLTNLNKFSPSHDDSINQSSNPASSQKMKESKLFDPNKSETLYQVTKQAEFLKSTPSSQLSRNSAPLQLNEEAIPPPLIKKSSLSRQLSKESSQSPQLSKESSPFPQLNKESSPSPLLNKESSQFPQLRKESSPSPQLNKESSHSPQLSKESSPLSPLIMESITSPPISSSKKINESKAVNLPNGSLSSSCHPQEKKSALNSVIVDKVKKPITSWLQTPEEIFIYILSRVPHFECKVISKRLLFTGIIRNIKYQFEEELFKEVEADSCKTKDNANSIEIILSKKKSGLWDRLFESREQYDWLKFKDSNDSHFLPPKTIRHDSDSSSMLSGFSERSNFIKESGGYPEGFLSDNLDSPDDEEDKDLLFNQCN